MQARDRVVHGDRSCLTGVDLREPMLDFRRPRHLGIIVRLPVQASHEHGCEPGTIFFIERECGIEYLRNRPAHSS